MREIHLKHEFPRLTPAVTWECIKSQIMPVVLQVPVVKVQVIIRLNLTVDGFGRIRRGTLGQLSTE